MYKLTNEINYIRYITYLQTGNGCLNKRNLYSFDNNTVKNGNNGFIMSYDVMTCAGMF